MCTCGIHMCACARVCACTCMQVCGRVSIRMYIHARVCVCVCVHHTAFHIIPTSSKKLLKENKFYLQHLGINI